MRTWVTAMGCLAVTARVLTGCSADEGVATGPSVAKDALQKDISGKLATAGAPPRSVVCKDDLVGEVGRTTTCDVDLSSTNRVQANVVVTAVNGATVDYDTRPSESQAQLDDSLKATLEKAGSATIDSVSCESGLAGTLGATAYCNVTSGSSTTRQLVEVDEVNGLAMNYTVVPHLAKAVVEDSLLDQLQRQRGQRPEAATCAGDLQGVPNATEDCDVFADGHPQTFTLTVTAVEGAHVDFHFAPKP